MDNSFSYLYGHGHGLVTKRMATDLPAYDHPNYYFYSYIVMLQKDVVVDTTTTTERIFISPPQLL